VRYSKKKQLRDYKQIKSCAEYYMQKEVANYKIIKSVMKGINTELKVQSSNKRNQ
jgi:hypothetical protein